ncbi:hypothetical protein XF36_13455 [Pseudonocardia sp. HH130629-09]|nr:hypothetical protein XF36_13455 [Pseudonocardia sp. HH130629-09]
MLRVARSVDVGGVDRGDAGDPGRPAQRVGDLVPGDGDDERVGPGRVTTVAAQTADGVPGGRPERGQAAADGAAAQDRDPHVYPSPTGTVAGPVHQPGDRSPRGLPSGCRVPRCGTGDPAVTLRRARSPGIGHAIGRPYFTMSSVLPDVLDTVHHDPQAVATRWRPDMSDVTYGAPVRQEII